LRDGGDLPQEIREKPGQLYTVDATRIAQQVYDPTTIPINNVIVLGAYCAAMGDAPLQTILAALPEFFPQDKVPINVEAAQAIGSAKRAAIAIDHYLRGDDLQAILNQGALAKTMRAHLGIEESSKSYLSNILPNCWQITPCKNLEEAELRSEQACFCEKPNFVRIVKKYPRQRGLGGNHARMRV